MEKTNKMVKPTLSFSSEFKKFTDETTFHGIRFVFNGEYGILRRMIWLVLVLGMTSALVVMLIYSLLGFYEYNSVTSTSNFFARNLTIPSVTICPNNYMSEKQLRKLYQPQFVDSILTAFKNLSMFTYDYFKSNLLKLLDQGIMNFNENIAPKGTFVKCIIANIPVNCSLYISHMLTDRGICYTFHSREYIDKHGAVISERPGHAFGLTIILDADPDDYVHSFVQGTGFHVLIHNPDVYPSMLEQAFVMGPGMAVYVPITKTISHHLKKPYSEINCVDDTDKLEYRKYSFGKDYSEEGCRAKCLDDTIYDCNCSLYSSGKDACTWRDHFTCTVVKIQEISTTQLYRFCNYCLPLCEETKFAYKISSMEYPNNLAEPYANSLNLPVKTKEEMNKRYVELNVYYESLRYSVTQQVPATTLGQLFSNFGGLMGLFLGASILTVIEFLDFTVMVFMKMFIPHSKSND